MPKDEDKKVTKLEVVYYKGDVEVKKVLEGSMDQDEIIVVGVKDGELSVATSSGKLEKIILRLEQAKLKMLHSYSDVDI